MYSTKLIERLIIYKHFLEQIKKNDDNKINIFSHELADLTNFTPSQIRKDIMIIEYSGNQKNGYNIDDLINHIKTFLNPSQNMNMIIIGVGNLGKAILHYFANIKSKYSIIACFDIDKNLIGSFIYYTKCYHIDELEKIIKENNVKNAILTLPPENAQGMTDVLINYGIQGIINFTTIRLKVPSNVYVENIDFLASIEKISFFTRKD
jgi:redox-sensing transcriptional repressor